MKAAQLRQAILQAAVQGKLVPQNPQDEPASVLLGRIQAEKAKLVKEGKIKKEKIATIAGDETPYELPEGWTWVKLGQIAITAHSGWSPQCLSHGRFGEEWGVLKVSAVSWGIFKPKENKALPKNIHPKAELAVQVGDFLISRANTDDLVARSVIVDTPVKNIMLCDKIVRFQLAEGVDKHFVNNANLSLFSRKYYIKHASGTSSSMKNVSRDVMLNLPIPLPPLAEQRRIVTKIKELMSLCDELEAAEKKLDALESNFAEYLPKSILQAAVQGKLVPQNLHDEPASELLKRIQTEKARLIKKGKIKKEKPLPPITEDEIPYDLPDGWEWCRLGELIQLTDNNNIHKTLPSDAAVNYVDIESIDNKKYQIKSAKIEPVKSLSSRARRVLRKGYIAYSLVRPYLDNIAIIEDEKENYIGSTGLVVFRPIGMETRFFMTILLSPYIREYYLSILSGFNSPSVSQEDFLMTPIPFPPIAEQQRIIAKVDELMALCEQLKSIDANILSPLPGAQQLNFSEPVLTFEEPEEQYAMAARGDVSATETKEHQQAMEDLFGDGADG